MRRSGFGTYASNTSGFSSFANSNQTSSQSSGGGFAAFSGNSATLGGFASLAQQGANATKPAFSGYRDHRSDAQQDDD